MRLRRDVREMESQKRGAETCVRWRRDARSHGGRWMVVELLDVETGRDLMRERTR